MPCGNPHTYQNIDDTRMNKILTGLKKSGAFIEGTNSVDCEYSETWS